MFSPKKPEQRTLGKPPMPTPRKASLPKEEPKPSVEKSTDEPDLPKDEIKKSVPSPKSHNIVLDENKSRSPSKKLAGAVPLFGGIDPFAVNKPESSSHKEEFCEDILSISSHVKSESLKPATSDKSVAVKDSVSFDDPVEISPLPNAGKVRPKVQARRRLPTRKGRQEALRKSQALTDTSDIEEQNTQKPITVTEKQKESDKRREESLQSRLKEMVTSPSTEEEDLFSISEPVLVPVMTGKIKKIPKGVDINESKPKAVPSAMDNSKDIFNGLPNSPEEKKIDVKENGDRSDGTKILSIDQHQQEEIPDLFSSAFSNSKDKTAATHSNSQTQKANRTKSKSKLFDDESDDDDLFAYLKNRTKKPSSPAVPKNTKKQMNSLFGDSDDDDMDIFSSSAAT